ncbi:hypothetical protein LJB42_000959 [Komagataella kurtzmanii]|nr:hypothetical protein LJB42_000959 [Komagataella kurtzmanii]
MSEFMDKAQLFWTYDLKDRKKAVQVINSSTSTDLELLAGPQLLSFVQLLYGVFACSSLAESAFNIYHNLSSETKTYYKACTDVRYHLENKCKHYDLETFQSLVLILILGLRWNVVPLVEEVGKTIRAAQLYRLNRDPMLYHKLKNEDSIMLRRTLWWLIFSLDGRVSHVLGLPPILRLNDFDTSMSIFPNDIYRSQFNMHLLKVDFHLTASDFYCLKYSYTDLSNALLPSLIHYIAGFISLYDSTWIQKPLGQNSVLREFSHLNWPLYSYVPMNELIYLMIIVINNFGQGDSQIHPEIGAFNYDLNLKLYLINKAISILETYWKNHGELGKLVDISLESWSFIKLSLSIDVSKIMVLERDEEIAHFIPQPFTKAYKSTSWLNPVPVGVDMLDPSNMGAQSHQPSSKYHHGGFSLFEKQPQYDPLELFIKHTGESASIPQPVGGTISNLDINNSQVLKQLECIVSRYEQSLQLWANYCLPSKCYTLTLPQSADARDRLDCRTGASSLLSKSRIVVHGGLTLGLELESITIANISEALPKQLPSSLEINNSLLSNTVFELNIPERKWETVRVDEDVGHTSRPAPRMFHTICLHNHAIYVHGGLVLDEQRQFTPSNELWRFDLYRKTWSCLLASNDDDDSMFDQSSLPRFNHKMIRLKDLSIIGEPTHHGFLIVGGLNALDERIYSLEVYDIVSGIWKMLPGLPVNDRLATISSKPISPLDSSPSSRQAHSKSYLSYTHSENAIFSSPIDVDNPLSVEKLAVLTRVDPGAQLNPILSYSLNDIEPRGSRLLLNREHHTDTFDPSIPKQLRYPEGESFGENLVIMGFLPGDLNISIFVYSKSSAKWSRLNVFCEHSTWSHRFSKGYLWASHHKIILLGNEKTTRTSPSIQFFNLFVAISLPVTNSFSSLIDEQLSKNYLSANNFISTSDDFRDSPEDPNNVFNEYSKYAAPAVNMTSIKSVFPPPAVTVGKIAFATTDELSDFQLITDEGDRICIPLNVCMKRWGMFFRRAICKGYVEAIYEFAKTATEDDMLLLKKEFYTQGRTERHSVNSSIFPSSDVSSQDNLRLKKDTGRPEFRLPFQKHEILSNKGTPQSSTNNSRKNSVMSYDSSTSNSSGIDIKLFESSAIPIQLPPPQEPLPAPMGRRKSASFFESEKNIFGPKTPTLPHSRTHSPASSPKSSPRGSLVHSNRDGLMPSVGNESLQETEEQKGHVSDAPPPWEHKGSSPQLDEGDDIASAPAGSPESIVQDAIKLAIDSIEVENYDFSTLQPFLFTWAIPRSLYLPFPTKTVKAFSEFLYTGQVGATWELVPTALDVLLVAKFYEVPLLYDLILETLYRILSRKEVQLVKEAQKLKNEYVDVMSVNRGYIVDPPPIPSIDEFTEFLTKSDDGFTDLSLLKRASKASRMMSDSRGSSRGSSRKSSLSFTQLAAFKEKRREEEDGETEEGVDSEELADEEEVDDDERESVAELSEIEAKEEESEKEREEEKEEEEEEEEKEEEDSDDSTFEDIKAYHLDDSSNEDIGDGSSPLHDVLAFAQSKKQRPESPKDSSASGLSNSSDSGKESDSNDGPSSQQSPEEYLGTKDIVDKVKAGINPTPTLESTTRSADAVPVSIIDYIYEAAVLGNDLRLLLRALNVRYMIKGFETEKPSIKRKIEQTRKETAARQEEQLEQGTLLPHPQLRGQSSPFAHYQPSEDEEVLQGNVNPHEGTERWESSLKPTFSIKSSARLPLATKSNVGPRSVLRKAHSMANINPVEPPKILKRSFFKKNSNS